MRLSIEIFARAKEQIKIHSVVEVRIEGLDWMNIVQIDHPRGDTSLVRLILPENNHVILIPVARLLDVRHQS